MKILKNKIFYLIVFSFLSLIILLSGFCPTYVRAENSGIKFDETNVLDDLQDMTFDGKTFSLEEYNFDTSKKTQVLSFVEYCYSYDVSKQSNYALYVYVYNPKGLKFDTSNSLNKIQFATSKDVDSAYIKYPLIYLNKSERADYEGLFYKFKVDLTEDQKTAILNGVNSSSRVYKVSGFELVTQGALNATDYAVSLTYKYSGYAKGCGPNEEAESTLKFTSEGLETLALDVHATTYRPDGTNGKNDYTQDSLHSVYFAVPNKVIEQYGEMVAVHATWLNAVLKPALVTGNQEAYDYFSNCLGEELTSSSLSKSSFSYLGGAVIHSSGDMNVINCNYYYGRPLLIYGDNSVTTLFDYLVYAKEIISPLYMLFNSGEADNSADYYYASSSEIQDQLLARSNPYGGLMLCNKYSAFLFESFDTMYTNVNIKADETYSLDSNLQVLGESWWERLFGITHNVSSTFDGIQAIYPVKASDLSGNNGQISNKLYIGQQYVEDFKSYYNANKENSTIYLFRYQVTDYVSQEATLVEEGEDLVGNSALKVVDTNAYFFQETVNLDFDIIDVTFSTGEIETVIPVVSNPIDVIPGSSPPVYTKPDPVPDENPSLIEVLKIILGLFFICFILWFLSTTGVLKLVGNLIVWIITAPFKFIKWLIDKFRSD